MATPVIPNPCFTTVPALKHVLTHLLPKFLHPETNLQASPNPQAKLYLAITMPVCRQFHSCLGATVELPTNSIKEHGNGVLWFLNPPLPSLQLFQWQILDCKIGTF